MPNELERFVRDFAKGVERADSKRPVAFNKRSKKSFRPGIGPHSEAETVELVARELTEHRPERYAGRLHAAVPYPQSPRQRCDLCIADEGMYSWAIEVKMLRFLGDNGKANDNILMHVLSPYPGHRSALTDCDKLVDSGLAPKLAVLIYGFDSDDWPLDPAINAFEILAAARVDLGKRIAAGFGGLIHPVHQRGRVFGWDVRLRSHSQ